MLVLFCGIFKTVMFIVIDIKTIVHLQTSIPIFPLFHAATGDRIQYHNIIVVVMETSYSIYIRVTLVVCIEKRPSV